MPFPLLLVAAAAGAGVQAYGAYRAGQAKAQAYEREAKLKGMQADELLAREAINEQILQEKEQRMELYTARDTGTMGGGSLAGITQLRRDLQVNFDSMRRDSEWKARMLRMGAEADFNLADETRTAGTLTAVGGLLGFAGSFYSSARDGAKPSTDTKDLGSFGNSSTGQGYNVSGSPILGAGPVRQPMLPQGYGSTY